MPIQDAPRVLLVRAGPRQPPSGRPKLAEPPALRLPLEATLVVQAPVGCSWSSALVSRTALTIGAVRAPTGPRPSRQLRGRYGGQRDADVDGLRSADHASAVAQISNALAYPTHSTGGFVSRQVRHQPQRRLLHAELGVVGGDRRSHDSAIWNPAPMA